MSTNCNHPTCPTDGECRRPKKQKSVTAIPKRSKSLEEEMKLYRKEVAEYLKPGDLCEMNTPVCNGLASCVHHKRGRIGELLRDQRYWMKACPHCNGWVEAHHALAEAMGLKLSKHEPNYKRTK